jgi:hypothetical protein
VLFFSNSVTLESPFASESAVVSSVGLIASVISGVLFVIIGGYFLMKRLRKNDGYQTQQWTLPTLDL